MSNDLPTINMMSSDLPTINLMSSDPPTINLMSSDPPTINLISSDPPTINLMSSDPPTINLISNDPPTINLMSSDPPTIPTANYTLISNSALGSLVNKFTFSTYFRDELIVHFKRQVTWSTSCLQHHKFKLPLDFLAWLAT